MQCVEALGLGRRGRKWAASHFRRCLRDAGLERARCCPGTPAAAAGGSPDALDRVCWQDRASEPNCRSASAGSCLGQVRRRHAAGGGPAGVASRSAPRGPAFFTHRDCARSLWRLTTGWSSAELPKGPAPRAGGLEVPAASAGAPLCGSEFHSIPPWRSEIPSVRLEASAGCRALCILHEPEVRRSGSETGVAVICDPAEREPPGRKPELLSRETRRHAVLSVVGSILAGAPPPVLPEKGVPGRAFRAYARPRVRTPARTICFCPPAPPAAAKGGGSISSCWPGPPWALRQRVAAAGNSSAA